MAQLSAAALPITEASFVALPEDEQALRMLLIEAAWSANACGASLLYEQLREGSRYDTPSTAWERRNARLKLSGWIAGRKADERAVPKPILKLVEWLEERSGDDAYIGRARTSEEGDR